MLIGVRGRTAMQLVYPAACTIMHLDFVEPPDEATAKYESPQS